MSGSTTPTASTTESGGYHLASLGGSIAKQMRSSEVSSVIQAFVARNGEFAGKDVTDYLKKFDRTTQYAQFTDTESLLMFPACCHEDIKDTVRSVCRSFGKTWEEVKDELRE